MKRVLSCYLNIIIGGKHICRWGRTVVLPENTYYLIFLNYFRREVNLGSSVIVAAEEDSEP